MNQFSRWIVAILVLVLIALSPSIVFALCFGQGVSNISLGIGFGLLAWSFATWVVGKNGLFLTVPGNAVWLGNNLLSNARDGDGIKTYTAFMGGLNAKFPWEPIEMEIDLPKDVVASFNFGAEMSGMIGTFKGRVDFHPDHNNLQAYCRSGSNRESTRRDTFLQGKITAMVSPIIARLVATQTFEAVRVNLEYWSGQVTAALRASGIQRDYGIVIDAVNIEDVSLSARVQDAYEEPEMARRRGTALQEFIRSYRAATGHNPSPEETKAYVLSMTTDEHNLGFNVTGLENLTHLDLSGLSSLRGGGGGSPRPGGGRPGGGGAGGGGAGGGAPRGGRP